MQMEVGSQQRPKPRWRTLLHRGAVAGGRLSDLLAQWLHIATDPRSRLLRQRRRALRWGLIFTSGCLFWVLTTTLLASWSTPPWVLLITGLIAAGAAGPATLLLLRYLSLRRLPLPARRPGTSWRMPPPGSAARPAMSALKVAERGLFAMVGVLDRGKLLPADEIEELTAVADRTTAAMAATAGEVVSMEQTERFNPASRAYLASAIDAYSVQLDSGVRQYNELVTAAAQLVSAINAGAPPRQHRRDELTAATDRMVGWAQAFDELNGVSRPGLLRR